MQNDIPSREKKKKKKKRFLQIPSVPFKFLQILLTRKKIQFL